MSAYLQGQVKTWERRLRKQIDTTADMCFLSLDGGGIYGLCAALWLKALCQRNEHFLSRDGIDLFAGTSAGAVNALLMARHANPREAVLDGELERYWKDQRSFSNRDPWTSMLSFMGLSAWYSAADQLELLGDYFGDLKLGELKHKVLISAYNWTGSPAGAQRFETSTGLQSYFQGLWAKPEARAPGDHWRPKFYTNDHPDDCDVDVRVVDVAYAAQCAPGFRSLRGGMGDGASFSANPAVPALAHKVRERLAAYATVMDTLDEDWKKLALEEEFAPGGEAFLRQRLEGLRESAIGRFLGRAHMLSVGSGQALPRYGFQNVDLSGPAFHQKLPTNPFLPVTHPPADFALDAASSESEYIAARLVDSRNYLRLNPGVLSTPTLTANIWARFEPCRQAIIREIYRAAESQASREAVDEAAAFIERHEGLNRRRLKAARKARNKEAKAFKEAEDSKRGSE